MRKFFPGQTDFTVAIFKIPQISKHFSAMLDRTLLYPTADHLVIRFLVL